MKKLLAGFMVSSMLVVTACGGNNSAAPENPGGSGSQDQVELKFTMWGNERHMEMYEELLQDFYVTHPNIKVRVETIPHADYQQKLSVLAAGNELPDVGWVAERMVPQFVQNNIMRDVSSFRDEPDFEFDDLIPSTLELWEHDGKLLGIPFSTPPMIMYYNKTLFENAGLPTPTELAQSGEWTWEKFEETAEALSSGSGSDRVYGANLWMDWTNFATIPSHTLSYGGQMFSDDMTSFAWNSPQGVATFEMINRMMFEDRSHVPPGETIPFESGKVGMFTFMYSYIANIRDIETFDWDIAPLPEGPEGRAPLLGQAGIVAFEQSDHPEEAMELLKFLGSKKGIQAQSAFFVPPRKSVLESDEFVNVPNNPSRESIELALINEMQNGFIYPLHKDWTRIESEIVKGFDMLFARAESPEEILRQLEANINSILE